MITSTPSARKNNSDGPEQASTNDRVHKLNFKIISKSQMLISPKNWRNSTFYLPSSQWFLNIVKLTMHLWTPGKRQAASSEALLINLLHVAWGMKSTRGLFFSLPHAKLPLTGRSLCGRERSETQTHHLPWHSWAAKKSSPRGSDNWTKLWARKNADLSGPETATGWCF